MIKFELSFNENYICVGHTHLRTATTFAKNFQITFPVLNLTENRPTVRTFNIRKDAYDLSEILSSLLL